ncbi:hypothetical protein [Peribacillus simplex]|nr:hypothetical protein [Peribacillus simplex]MEC1396707.1 hypothetical protein [Peribacillus simplex]
MFFYYFILDETLTGLKKFATLLRNNWLAETLLDAWQTVNEKGAKF